MLFKQWAKNEDDDTFLWKKKQKQNSVTIMTSGDGKGTISSVKLKLKGESFE